MPATRRFLVTVDLELTQEDRDALEQAGADLEGSSRIRLRAADEEQATVRVAAALGGHEHFQIQPLEP
jgi:hypothetical protein